MDLNRASSKAKRHSINEKFSYYHKNLLPRSKRSIYHLFNDIFGKSSTILSNKSTFSNNHNLGYYVYLNVRKYSMSHCGMCQRELEVLLNQFILPLHALISIPFSVERLCRFQIRKKAVLL